jgi:hypothetical protein
MAAKGADVVVVASSIESHVSWASCDGATNRVCGGASVVGFFWYFKDVVGIGGEVERCKTGQYDSCIREEEEDAY